jgi:hypothetical protein
VGRPQGVFGGLIYYQLPIFFFNIVPLIMEFTSCVPRLGDQSIAMRAEQPTPHKETREFRF